jgi:hypothetical protein
MVKVTKDDLKKYDLGGGIWPNLLDDFNEWASSK